MIFQVSSQTVPSAPHGVPSAPHGLRLCELQPSIHCRPPPLSPVREGVPPAAGGFTYPFQMPLSRPQIQSPFEYANHCFRPPTCEPVFRPQPLPRQHLQLRDASFTLPTFPPPCSPRVMPPFEPLAQCYAMDAGSCVFPGMRPPPFLMPPFSRPPPLQSLPHSSELNAAGVPVGVAGTFMQSQSSSESDLNKRAMLNPATQSCAVSEAVQVQNRPVFPDSSKNPDYIPQKTSDNKCDSNSSSSSAYVCPSDEHKMQSRRRQRKSSERSLHSPESHRSRESRHSSSSHRDSHRNSGKQRVSRLENR